MISLVMGRFQGLHFGQFGLIRSALMSGADKLQIIIGSSFQPRTFKNPFLFGSSSYGSFIGDKDAFSLIAVAKTAKDNIVTGKQIGRAHV